VVLGRLRFQSVGLSVIHDECMLTPGQESKMEILALS
jgi:hypothetical protein